MNKPIVSSATSAAKQAGGVVLFEGGSNPFRAGFGAVLTVLIKAIAKSKFSHSTVLPRGSTNIFESTIKNGISGPQCNDLEGTLAGYGNEGGHAWIYQFQPQFEPNWDDLVATAEHMIALREAGKMPYNIPRLFGDAVQRSLPFDIVTFPADGFIDYMAAHSTGVVCSEQCAIDLHGGGVVTKMKAAGIPWMPKVNPPNQPIGCSPQDLANLPIFLAPVQLL